MNLFVRTVAEAEDPEAAGAVPEPTTPKAPPLRLFFEAAFAAIVGRVNEATAAAAGGPLPVGGGTLLRRARRSSRDSVVAADTARFLEREISGAIAMNDSSEHRVSYSTRRKLSLSRLSYRIAA